MEIPLRPGLESSNLIPVIDKLFLYIIERISLSRKKSAPSKCSSAIMWKEEGKGR